MLSATSHLGEVISYQSPDSSPSQQTDNRAFNLSYGSLKEPWERLVSWQLDRQLDSPWSIMGNGCQLIFRATREITFRMGRKTKNLNICIWSSSRQQCSLMIIVWTGQLERVIKREVPGHGSNPHLLRGLLPLYSNVIRNTYIIWGSWHRLSMQLPTGNALVLVIFPLSIAAYVSFPKHSLFITALSRKSLPEESHRSDFVLQVNPALEGYSHLHERKQEKEANWRALKKASKSIFTHPFMQPTNNECILHEEGGRRKGDNGEEEERKFLT